MEESDQIHYEEPMIIPQKMVVDRVCLNTVHWTIAVQVDQEKNVETGRLIPKLLTRCAHQVAMETIAAQE